MVIIFGVKMSDYENLLRSILSASPDDRNNAENTMNNML